MQIKVDLKFLRDAEHIYAAANGVNETSAFAANFCALRPATPQSAGLDLCACIEEASLSIAPGERVKVGSGIAIDLSHASSTANIAAFVFSRSGLGAKTGLVVAQGVGVIDPDYRGEIIIWLLNTSQENILVKRGERVAQLVFLNFFKAEFNIVNELSQSERGEGGFGHTGR